MGRPPLIIYHGNCPDGFCAAWIVHRALGSRLGVEPELFVGSYGEDPPYELAKDRYVIVVDFSYPRPKLEQLFGVCSMLQVLDHHKTAQADLEGLHYCAFDMNRSGAGMAWDYFHSGEPRPWVVDYVEDRDLWRFKLPHSEAISLRIRLTPHDLEAWDGLAQRGREMALNESIGAQMYLRHYVQDALRNAYFLYDVCGEQVIVVNCTYTGVSDVLNDALERFPLATIALGWHMTADGMLNCSLRSRRGTDCSVFAKALGGGGHAQAAGFRISPQHALAKRLLRFADPASP